MKTIKGPAIFLAQFAGPEAPFNSLPAIARWAREKGSLSPSPSSRYWRISGRMPSTR